MVNAFELKVKVISVRGYMAVPLGTNYIYTYLTKLYLLTTMNTAKHTPASYGGLVCKLMTSALPPVLNWY